MRQQGKIAEAKEQLLVCVNAECPRLVRDDCASWLAALDQPEHAARDSSAASENPAAAPPALPPTESAQPAPTAARSEAPLPRGDAASGQADHRLDNQTVAPAATKPLLSPPGVSDLPQGRASRVPARVFGALALVAVTSGAYLGISGWADARDLRSTCAPACEPSRVSAIRTKLIAADVSLLVGVGLASLTAWLIWQGERPFTPGPTQEGVTLSLQDRGLGLQVFAPF